jgi:hypothetical protein
MALSVMEAKEHEVSWCGCELEVIRTNRYKQALGELKAKCGIYSAGEEFSPNDDRFYWVFNAFLGASCCWHLWSQQ